MATRKVTHATFPEVGERFGLWTVIGPQEALHRVPHTIGCRCECGRERMVDVRALRVGRSTTCGCTRRARFTGHKHGLRHTPEYATWQAMLSRCHRPSQACWKYYGGRGIVVCDRWRHSFSQFLADMGQKPTPGHSLDRVDSEGHYEPSNCRWATFQQQMRNTSRSRVLEIDGVRRTVVEWAERSGMKPGSIYTRLRLGWDVSRAVFAPLGSRR